MIVDGLLSLAPTLPDINMGARGATCEQFVLTSLLDIIKKYQAIPFDEARVTYKLAKLYMLKEEKGAMIYNLEKIVKSILTNDQIEVMNQSQKTQAEEILSETFKMLINEYNKDESKAKKKQEMIEIFN